MWWRRSWLSLNGTMGIQGKKGALSYATQLPNTNQPIRAPRCCQLYVVAETGEDTGQGAVKVSDVNTKAIIATVAMNPCESQSDVAITPDGRLAYVLDSTGFGPAVIDTTTGD